MHVIKYVFLLVLTFYGCSEVPNPDLSAENKSETAIENDPKSETDSLEVWISADFSASLNKNISICDCWRDTKFHLLYLDTIEQKVYLKSNLKHFGHDSEFRIQYETVEGVYFLDTTIYDPRLQPKKLVQNSTDQITFQEGNATYTFNKRIIAFEKEDEINPTSNFDLSNLFYALNSEILLKYNAIDTIQSTHDLINIEELRDQIKSGKVSGHCSDDFGWDGMSILGDTNRSFHLEFRENQVSIYDELEGRDRYQKLDLGTLPKQVLKISEISEK